MAVKAFSDILIDLSKQHRFDLVLVCAIVLTESAGNPYAVRSEADVYMDDRGRDMFKSRWRYPLAPGAFAEKLGCTLATEKIGQLTSWGAMQVMGSVAREHGFLGWFPELCSWEKGCEYGLRHLRKKADIYGTDPATLYAAYNAGSPRKTKAGMFENQRAVDHFMRNYRRAQEELGL